ncbi:hypothetical protein [uncultured Sneathia sp.]|uniref:hypothetical protein n=1 Tax=uncultured Sneathia sp. TaxID=278067 RepID=UPI002803CB6D|nr:hypothetical protein [uncultured Sneathia sp.]
MMITFVGFASNKPKDNFDYYKYVGSYIMEDNYSNDDDNYLAFQIKKRGNDVLHPKSWTQDWRCSTNIRLETTKIERTIYFKLSLGTYRK